MAVEHAPATGLLHAPKYEPMIPMPAQAHVEKRKKKFWEKTFEFARNAALLVILGNLVINFPTFVGGAIYTLQAALHPHSIGYFAFGAAATEVGRRGAKALESGSDTSR